MALTDKLIAIGNAIRAKTGRSGSLTLEQMVTEIGSISGGGLPAGFTAIATGTHTISADTNGTFTVEHGLGQVPDLFLMYRNNGNIAMAASMLGVLYNPTMAYRGSTYKQYAYYHGTSTTTVSCGNGTTRPVTAISASTVTLSYYSSNTYYWRAGTYTWVAIKF